MKPDLVIGIDNGLTGGLVSLSTTVNPQGGGCLIACLPMPVLKSCREIDGDEVAGWIRRMTNGHPTVVALEECPKHANQASVMRSMATSYGILVGAITAGTDITNSQIVRVRSGNPKDSWQRVMLGNLKKGETKAAALKLAGTLWPDETWIVGKMRTPHTGLIDAALIAEFYRRMMPVEIVLSDKHEEMLSRLDDF